MVREIQRKSRHTLRCSRTYAYFYGFGKKSFQSIVRPGREIEDIRGKLKKRMKTTTTNRMEDWIDGESAEEEEEEEQYKHAMQWWTGQGYVYRITSIIWSFLLKKRFGFRWIARFSRSRNILLSSGRHVALTTRRRHAKDGFKIKTPPPPTPQLFKESMWDQYMKYPLLFRSFFLLSTFWEILSVKSQSFHLLFPGILVTFSQSSVWPGPISQRILKVRWLVATPPGRGRPH